MGQVAAATWYKEVGAQARRFPQRVAVVDASRSLNYGELAGETEVLCAWLAEQGLRPGDRLGIRLARGWREVVAMTAAMRMGAVFVNLHSAQSATQLRHVMADADIRFLLVEAPQVERLSRELAIVQPDPLDVVRDGGGFTLMRWTDPSVPRPPLGLWEPIETELATLIYTSGSTGTPKGVMHSQANLLAYARNVASYLGAGPDDRVLSLLPLSFSYGLGQMLTTLYVGGCLVIQSSALPGDVLNALARYEITGLAAVPTLWRQLFDGLERSSVALPALRYITNSGGALSEQDARRLAQLLPSVQMYSMFGTTEALRSTYLPPEQFAMKPGAIGKAIPNVSVIVLAEDGRVCGPGEQGEMVHVGDQVSQGYWKRPDETARRFRRIWHDGRWQSAYATGDTVRIDEDGVLWFLHRADWMVKSGGFRISLEEVEHQLRATGLVAEAAAIAVEDELLGQAVIAVIGGPPAWVLDETALRHACLKLLPRYMVPRSFLRWPGTLPLLPNGKLDRVAMRAAVQDGTLPKASEGDAIVIA